MKTSIFIIFLSLFLLVNYPLPLNSRPRLDNSTDQEALLSFKSLITNDPNGILSTWTPNTSMCTHWHGVICNPNKTRVTSLSLTNLTLSGKVTQNIGNLSFLRVLDLGSNFFHGSIPDEIGFLIRLTTLNLTSNNFYGKIPLSLSGCSRLQALDLSENHLIGTIPSELGTLSMLQDLTFAKNNLTGIIPTSFGNLSSLINLVLNYNYQHGPIPTELGRLSRLLQLSLAVNSFSGEIPNSLFNLSSIVILSLTKNLISGHLPSNLFIELPDLANFYVGGNLFSGRIPSSLSNATNLEQADFSGNEFVGHVPLLWNLPNLRILNLEINQLTSEGDQGLEFITSLTNSSFLQVFSLATNQFTGQLPPSIGNLSSQLSLFAIAENHFEGTLPESIGNLENLIMVSIEFNSFTGIIPSTIGSLQNLQSLFLHLNHFSGSIPESFGNLSQLYELGLSSNNLTGSIPPNLSNCRYLQSLDLSMNGLTGKIPKEILSLPNLGRLVNFSWNSLSGALPFEIGNLKMVQGLDISRNKLTGEIPSNIGDCANLLYLDMSRNSFQGSIPRSLSNMKGIEYIDLSSNLLSGPIPSLIGTLQYLTFLNLSANVLRGEVPKQGVFLNSSGVFLNENFDLCGGIPVLQLPECYVSRSHSGKSKRILIVALSTSAAISMLFFIAFLVFLSTKRKRQQCSVDTNVFSFDGLHRYSYYDLKSATNDFSADNLIGRGSFGVVYKGVLRDGTIVAIKVLDMSQKGALKSFSAECEALRNVRHRNLLKIMSACSTPTFKGLVLQFMPNGSLEKWIHSENHHRLSLRQRLEIAVNVADAMEYLHHGCVNPLVHCDLKPSNILLDLNMVAHVGDFGLAKMFHGAATNDLISDSIGLKGSIGYIAPEYGFGGQVSTKGDVYSYGILLLEMMTGKRPTEDMFSGELNLQKWVKAAVPDSLTEILEDELLDKKSCAIHLTPLIEIGLMCASNAHEDRPEMKVVSPMIKRIIDMIHDSAP